jgi:hypothetical protein
MERRSNVPTVIAAVVGTVVFAVSTYIVVEVAGGTKVESSDSNTPNGVTPGPPDFK